MGVESKKGAKRDKQKDPCGSLVDESTKTVECNSYQATLGDAGGQADRNKMVRFLCGEG